MKRVSPLVALLSLCACVLVGCQLATSSLVVRSTGGASGPTGYEVDVQNPELTSVIQVVRAVGRTDEGERVAQVDVQNLTQSLVKLEYQFRWRDRFGSELISLWDWRNISVEAGKTIRLEDEAIDSEWVHYIVELRRGK